MRKNHRNTHVHRNDNTYSYIRVYQHHTHMYFNVQTIEQNSGKRERKHEKSQENDKFLITHEYRKEWEPTCKCRIDNELLHHCLRNLCGDAWKWENSRQQPEQMKENQSRTEGKKKSEKKMKSKHEVFCTEKHIKNWVQKGKRDPVTLHLNNDWYSLCTSYDFFLVFFWQFFFSVRADWRRWYWYRWKFQITTAINDTTALLPLYLYVCILVIWCVLCSNRRGKQTNRLMTK